MINKALSKTYTVDTYKMKYNLEFYKLITCSECVPRFRVNVGACKACPGNCIACDPSDVCTTADPGYFIDTGNSNAVTKCPTGCATCTTAALCQTCIAPYTLASDAAKCILCTTECATCADADKTKCVTCNPPYSINPNSTPACYRCAQDLCKNCDSADNTKCL